METPSKARPGLQQLDIWSLGRGCSLVPSLVSESPSLSQIGSSPGAQDMGCARLTLSKQEESLLKETQYQVLVCPHPAFVC